MENIVKQQFKLSEGIELIFDFDAEEQYFDVRQVADSIISFVKEKNVKIVSIQKQFEEDFDYQDEGTAYYQIHVDACFFPKSEEDEEDVEFSKIEARIYAPSFSDDESVAAYELNYSQKISTEMIVSGFEKLFLLLEMDLA